MTGAIDPRTPVLVGVGTAAGSGAEEATDLMAAAVLAAAADAGVADLASRADRIAVPQGTWSYPDPARLVAAAVGASGARTHLVEVGVPQQSLVNEALAAIAAGRSEVAVVVGGEAKARADAARRAGTDAPETPQPGAVPDAVVRRPGPVVDAVEVATGLWEPVVQYAMIDSALRAAEEQTVGAHRAGIARLWERFNQVAAANPAAAFGTRRTAGEIDTPGPGNRLLAFPYNKWHATQWGVDQAAALLLCAAEVAEDAGVSRDRWVFPLVALESSHAVSLLRRAQPWRWPAMEVLGRATAAHLGRPVAEVEVAEVYSCFPAAVRVQQRALGLDPDGTPTVTGGMAFAGGPFNNFTYQALAAVVARLRADPGSLGMVTTVSGLLTKPGIGVWGTHPPGAPPLVADLAATAELATDVVPAFDALDAYSGPGVVVAYTVTPSPGAPPPAGPGRTVVLADTPGGMRAVATCEEQALAERAMAEELVGVPVHLEQGSFRLA